MALPIAAMMAVGVARTRAQGQNTTRMVTARIISPVTAQVMAAALSAMTTIQVAQRSARPTILALPASALCTRRIMRWMELSSPTRVARMSKEPKRFTVPDETSSPTPLSTGRLSPVITAWSTEVSPEIITPSTGIVSPGRTRSTSPTRTSVAGIISSPPDMRRAVCGVSCTSRSMPARALATVKSSSSAPSCMMNATSPAAKSWPVATDAMSASDTSTSALMSNTVIRPMTASSIIGTPQSMIATQAASKGSSTTPDRLTSSETPHSTRKTISRFVPPHSQTASSTPAIL